eukprot:CAMPEP_0184018558 /NCGR_PEP_ID=MMETSP0954-20121128/8217_1 /TAXON_ID=627963 /ORGANISM="Aplanochytrium sp, Strain PBS07" /LENGTH=194 /DNA_ID=CAMNT_0026300035 /DNA_START=883 /DNA_END=1467 /DNA_ORIENTATION=-
MPGICGMSFGTPKRRRLSSIIPELKIQSQEDAIKALEQEKLEYEHKLLQLSGAAELAAEQYEKSRKESQCIFCKQKADESSYSTMKYNIVAYREGVMQSKYFAKRSRCMQKLAAMKNVSAQKRSHEWFTREIRKGRMICMKQQKLQTLRIGSCVCCGKPVKEFSTFLKSVDRLASSMESELHVHGNRKRAATFM